MTKREQIATELLAAMIIASEGKAMNTLVEKSVILADHLIEELNATEEYEGPSIKVV
jgi:hypothetical protein